MRRLKYILLLSFICLSVESGNLKKFASTTKYSVTEQVKQYYVVKPLYIYFGQSNCGRSRTALMTHADSMTGFVGLQSNCWINNIGHQEKFRRLNIGLNTQLYNANAADEFGMEGAFLSLMSQYTGQEQYMLKYGIGSTYLASTGAANDWLPSANESYKNMLDRYKNVLIEGKRVRVFYKLKAIIFMQGENDATQQGTADAYLTNLTTLFSTFRIDYISFNKYLGFDSIPDYKEVICKINPGTDVSQVYASTVQQAQIDYVAQDPGNRILISNDSRIFKADGVHYNEASQIQFGKDVFEALKLFNE